MSGTILVLDPVATNRIVFKVKLLGARYNVIPCSSVPEAHAAIDKDRPDLIVVEMSAPSREYFEFCAATRLCADTAGIPILALANFADRAARVACLSAGADDALAKPISDTLLFARIRSLLRMHTSDTNLTAATERALGFAEDQERFTRRGRVAVFTAVPIRARALVQSLETGGRFDVTCLDPARAFEYLAPIPDVIVIDARKKCDASEEGHALRLVSEFRSRGDTRSTELLVIIPEDGSAIGALALDLGASDTVSADASHDEIMLRLGKLHHRKVKLDRLRDTVRTGLEAAVTDPLTGLYNRRFAEPHIQAMSDRARESGTQFGILAIDVDHFKRINDGYGHSVGDQVLVSIATILRENVRSVDLVARYGGEEFLVAMPDTTPAEAEVAAERLRDLIGQSPVYVEVAGGPISVTVSVGVALCHKNSTHPEMVGTLMQRADAALYRSKSSGRNMVSVASSRVA